MEDNSYFINKVYKKYLIFTTIALFATTAISFINNIIIGNNYGKIGLSIANLISPIYFVYSSIGALIAVGASTCVIACISRDDNEGKESYVSLGIVLMSILSISAAIIGNIFIDELLNLLCGSNEIYPQSKEYLRVMLIGGVSVTFMYYPFNFFKCDGRPELGVIMLWIMTGLDVILALVFVKFLNIGIVGVALAQVIATFIADIFGFIFLFRNANDINYGKIIYFIHSSKKIISIGSSMALNNVCNILKILILNRMVLDILATDGFAVFAIVMSFYNLLVAFISGIVQTNTPFFGVFYWEKDYTSVKQVWSNSLKYGVFIIGLCTLITIVFPLQISYMFGLDYKGIEKLIYIAFIWKALSLIIELINNVYVYYYFVIERVLLANILTLLRGIVFVLIYAYILPKAFGSTFIYSCFFFAEVSTFIALLFICRYIQYKNNDLKTLLLLSKYEEDEGKYISFSVENTIEEATYAAQKTNDFCVKNNIDNKTKNIIRLSIEEMLIVLFEHSLYEGKQYIDVRLWILDNDIVIRMRCAGKIFDPIAYYKKRESELDGDLLMDDSLGIKLILNLVENVSFKKTLGVNNLSILLKIQK